MGIFERPSVPVHTAGSLPDERTDRRHRPTRDDEHLAAVLGAVQNLNDTMGQLHVGLKTLRSVQQLGAEPRPLRGVSQSVSHSPGRLAGIQLRETSGTNPALIRLHDSAHTLDANGDLVIEYSLLPNESARDWFMPGGISFAYGLYVEVVLGTISGVVYLGNNLQS